MQSGLRLNLQICKAKTDFSASASDCFPPERSCCCLWEPSKYQHVIEKIPRARAKDWIRLTFHLGKTMTIEFRHFQGFARPAPPAKPLSSRTYAFCIIISKHALLTRCVPTERKEREREECQNTWWEIFVCTLKTCGKICFPNLINDMASSHDKEGTEGG